MSEVKVNKISPRTACGTVTLGDSGDTFTIPSGATITNSGTQTGFGRTGTVDWDTSIKTGTVTAATGSGYFVDTTSGGITVNLPAASVGSIVAVSDYASTSASNNITISPNGSDKINGTNDNYTISTAGLAVTLVYADATRGWKSVTGSDADATGVTPAYVTATGGTPCAGATSGDYKIHSFTGPGTLCVSSAGNCAGSNTIDYLVVAGGGGGGAEYAGGGGAGGYRESVPSPAAWTASPIANPGNARPVTVQGYPIAVGGGGTKGCGNNDAGGSGAASSFSDIPSAGGGGGAAEAGASLAGGSGGGGSYCSAGSAGNTPPTSPAQGFAGGSVPGPGGPGYGAAGGGGASEVGESVPTPTTPVAGAGGDGGTTCISASPTAYSGGGGGGGGNQPFTPGAGGAGGGGAGAALCAAGVAGTVNTGGGGGGGVLTCQEGGAGGSGIVIIRYKFQ
jgi:hypothetical protein